MNHQIPSSVVAVLSPAVLSTSQMFGPLGFFFSQTFSRAEEELITTWVNMYQASVPFSLLRAFWVSLEHGGSS